MLKLPVYNMKTGTYERIDTIRTYKVYMGGQMSKYTIVLQKQEYRMGWTGVEE